MEMMKRLAAFLLLIPLKTFAEGGCPAGYRPVDDGGFHNCVQFSSGQSGSSAQSVWETRWIAIALGGGGFGVGKDQPSKMKAEKLALSECKKTAATGKCSVSIATQNQCVAVSTGPYNAVTYGAATKERAEEMANRGCQDSVENRGAACQIFYSGCSYAERVR